MIALKLRRWHPVALALVLGFAVAGCDHVTDFDGPRLIDRFGDFALLDPIEASTDMVDFANGESVTFSGRFNKQVNWVVEITGQESGAVKRIQGFSAELTEDNARWLGGTTELPFFKTEAVEVALFVPEEMSDTTRTMVEVLTPRVYEGNVVADFEGGNAIMVTDPEFEFDENGISAEVPPAQGDGFYLLRGTDDVVVNNFFIGLITITPSGGGTFDVPTTIADELYLNAFLYNFGTPNTIPVLEVVVDANGTGTFEDGQDTIIPLGGDVEFPNLLDGFGEEGWQPYAEAASSFGQFGNGITDQQTQQIVAVRVVLISDAANQSTPPNQVDYGIDYITFTAGGPLEL